ncbi:MAG: hypothetical protein PHW69_07120 [Elusimicrobiaceae bacterium]|nr:hypothetical protein [Elusimicrobiaceae bacterium]
MIPRILLLTALLCAPAAAQESRSTYATDSSGNFYSATARFDGRKDYIHISRLDGAGYLVWETDYVSLLSQKPVAAVTGPDNLVILAARQMDGYKTLALAAYSYRNFLTWETAFDAGAQIIPVALAVDGAGNIYACGQIRGPSGRYKAKLWKYDRNGGCVWSAEYGDGSNNSYAQLLHLMYNGNIELGVKLMTGAADYGQYRRLSLVYSTDGQLLN